MPFRREPDRVAEAPRPPAMAPEAYVSALYELCLGRAADPEGLTAWSAELRATGDPTAVLAGMLASDEALERRGTVDAEERDAFVRRALPALGRRPRIVDVGASSLGNGTHPYSPLSDLMPVDIVGFDPLADRLHERTATEHVDGSIELLPVAVGDGETHTLYVNNDDATSSLFALNDGHNAVFNHLSSLHTVRTEEVPTTPLDTVLPSGPIDFLKLDVQGAELMVLRGGRVSVGASAVVHCEVEFSPIYVGQPLYPQIHEELATHGFELIDLLIPSRYHYLTSLGRKGPDRLLWADAVFFRRAEDPETLAAQALIAAVVYGKPTLAEHLLERAELL